MRPAPGGGRHDPAGEPVLRTERLGRQADGRTLVEEVSVSVHPGDVLAVVGPSGAGKSSFVRLLNRLDEPTSGTVYLDGRDYRAIDPRELRRRVGLVLQRPYLFAGTVADNLRYGPAQRGERLSDRDVERFLARVGLPGYGVREAARLSEGEAQRVSLARTLANGPDVLLLDEPTAALDEASREEVERTIRRVIEETGIPCVIVTHDRSQARRLASRALLLRGGRAERVGAAVEVL